VPGKNKLLIIIVLGPRTFMLWMRNLFKHRYLNLHPNVKFKGKL
jgi:hypothetical protein